MSSNDEIFAVERILARRTIKGEERKYFIKWLNYPEDRNTWEPASILKTISGWLADYDRAEDSKDNNSRMSTEVKQRNEVEVNLKRRCQPRSDNGNDGKKFKSSEMLESSQQEDMSNDSESVDSRDAPESVMSKDSGVPDVDQEIHFPSESEHLATVNSELKLLSQEWDIQVESFKSGLVTMEANEKCWIKRLDKKSKQIEDLTLRLETSEATKNSLEQGLRERDDRLENLKGLLETAKEKETSLATDLLAKTKEVQNLILRLLASEDTKNALQQIRYEKDQQLAELRLQFETYEKTEKSLHQSLFQKQQELQNVQKDLDKEKDTSNTRQQLFRKSVADFDLLEEKYKEKCDGYEQLQSSLTEADVKNIGLKFQNELLEKDVTFWKEKLNSSEKQLEDERKGFAQKEREMRTRMIEQEYEINQLRSITTRLAIKSEPYDT